MALAKPTGTNKLAEADVKFTGYLQISDIKGESTTKGFEDWISLESLSYAVAQATTHRHTSGAVVTGRANIGDVVITKQLDISSPKFYESCLKATEHAEAKIQLTRTVAGQNETYLTITLKKVYITEVGVVGGAKEGTNIPLEEIHLNFGEITYNYTQTAVRGGGSVEVMWNAESHA
ncbi:MAG: Hcp family type VI secretion system effector [Thermodesulfobacteriota bacterium]